MTIVERCSCFVPWLICPWKRYLWVDFMICGHVETRLWLRDSVLGTAGGASNVEIAVSMAIT